MNHGNRGWIQGRITKVSACEADINLISTENKRIIIREFKALFNPKGELTDAQVLKKACEHTFDESSALNDR